MFFICRLWRISTNFFIYVNPIKNNIPTDEIVSRDIA